MQKIDSSKKSLASLAVFRVLYDKDHDVFSVIKDFLSQIIHDKQLYSFTLKEITIFLNDTYDFSIPEAVVKTCLKRLQLSVKNGCYAVDHKCFTINKEVISSQKVIEKNNEEVISLLFEYVESVKKRTLSEDEKRILISSFARFLLEGSSHEHDEEISAFLITHNNNVDFKEKISTIREGVLLYEGIKYSNNLNNFKSLSSELTIFIETEILFHLAGFNGEVFQSLWSDFFGYVKEINRNSKSKKIHLRYFIETKNEIERFFNSAEEIVQKKKIIDPSKTAMLSIVNGCSSKSEVTTKKVAFFNQLDKLKIKQDDNRDYFQNSNHDFNIINSELLSKEEINDNRDILKMLNKVSILRKNSCNESFENIGFILLSGNSNSIKLAWNESIKSKGQVPLATTLDFLISKFWFKLNKGFGLNNYPRSFDLITKAQIVLSNRLNNAVNTTYDDLKKQYENKEISDEMVEGCLVELRKDTRKPEEITNECLDDVLHNISFSSVERCIEKQKILKEKVENTEKENTNLKAQLDETALNKDKLEQEKKQLIAENLKMKKNELKKLEGDLQQINNQCFQKINKSMIIFKCAFCLCSVIIFVTICYIVICQLGWEILAPWVWIVFTVLVFLFSINYFVIYDKEFKLLNFLTKEKKRIKDTIFQEYRADILKLEENIKQLKSDINNFQNNE